MAYEKLVSRRWPGLILLLLDESESMSHNLPGTCEPKCAWVERYFGLILQDLLARCAEMKGDQLVMNE